MLKRTVSVLICLAVLFSMCCTIIGCDSNVEQTTTPSGSSSSNSSEDKNSNSQNHNGGSNVNNNNNDNNNQNENQQSEPVNDFDLVRYDLDKYVYPIWETDVCYAEASFVRENANGKVEPLQLLYPIKNIVSVRSADLKTLYTEGVDYNITNDGKIEIIRSGSIPVLKFSDYYMPVYVNDGLTYVFPAADPNDKGGYIRAEVGTNNPGMAKWTIAVTYEHDAQSVISVPQDKSGKFNTLIDKLEAGEDITVVSMGDSITYGWSSSGLKDVSPYCPSYNRMVCKFIESKYGVNVNHVNIAVSGSGSGDGKNKIAEACAASPDLVFIAYGMNDGVATATSTYLSNINDIVEQLETRCPNASVVVVGTALPNAEVGYSAGKSLLNYHIDYATALTNAEATTWTKAAFADVTTVNVELLKIKVYQDVAGSNSNHPNDYMHRIYAQVVLRTIFGDYI